MTSAMPLFATLSTGGRMRNRKPNVETYADLGRDFGSSSGRVVQIVAQKERLNR